MCRKLRLKVCITLWLMLGLSCLSSVLVAAETKLPCYDMLHIIPCGQADFPRQAGDFAPAPKQDRFQLTFNDQIVWDQHNKIAWMRCSVGANLQNQHCNGATALSFEEAQAACAASALDAGGWRLPSVMELNSLLEVQQPGLKIDQQFFPDTQPAAYWSSDRSLTAPKPLQEKRAVAWHVNFATGAIFDALTQSPQFVRCVR